MNRAGAVFHPQRAASQLQQEMQIASFNFYWSLAQQDSASGVKAYPMTEYWDDCPHGSEAWYKTLMPSYRVMSAADLPPGVTCGFKYNTVAMNPLLLLPWLKETLVAKGVNLIRAEVKSFDEARRITNAKVVVNASGLGAKSLAGDETVWSVRGQTMFLKTDFEELVMREGSEYTYVIPRSGSGGVIMGGIKSERLDADVDVELKSDILMRVNRITRDAFKELDVNTGTDIVGFRPGRKGGLKVEREGDVIHAYGLEGVGYIYSFGVAERVRELIDGTEITAKL